MKRWITLLLILLAPLCVAATVTDYHRAIVTGYSGAAAQWCDGTCSDTEADLMCEDWEGTEQCTYTQSIAGTNAVDDDAAIPGDIGTDQGCSDQGSEAFDMDCNNPGNDCYYEYDITNSDAVYGTFYFYIVSETLDNTEFTKIAELTDTAGNSHIKFRLYHVGGSEKFSIRYRHTGGQKTENLATVTTGTWYRVDFTWLKNSSAPGITVTIDGGSQVTSGANTTTNVQAGDFQLGTEAGELDHDVNWVFAGIRLDDDTAPSACE